MERLKPYSSLAVIFGLGALWGMAEAVLGMALRSCASSVSGSIMTGVALFFMATGWAISPKIMSVAILVFIASFFKMFDAFLLSLPLRHGAIGNPIFAFFMEGISFLIFVAIIKEKILEKRGGQALLGGASALLAANLFPLVKYATGIPACVYPGTTYPLSLYYLPIAALTSSILVPSGLWLGKFISEWDFRWVVNNRRRRLRYFATSAIVFLCIAIVAFFRLL